MLKMSGVGSLKFPSIDGWGVWESFCVLEINLMLVGSVH